MENNILYILILILPLSVFIMFGRELYLSFKCDKKNIIGIFSELYFLIFTVLLTIIFFKILNENKNIETELIILSILLISSLLLILYSIILAIVRKYKKK
jgi:hypothetical protein